MNGSWAGFFAALSTFITVVIVPSVIMIIRELRKNKRTAVAGRSAIVEATEKNTRAVNAHAAVTEQVARETASLARVATGVVNLDDPKIRAVIDAARERGEIE